MFGANKKKLLFHDLSFNCRTSRIKFMSLYFSDGLCVNSDFFPLLMSKYVSDIRHRKCNMGGMLFYLCIYTIVGL